MEVAATGSFVVMSFLACGKSPLGAAEDAPAQGSAPVPSAAAAHREEAIPARANATAPVDGDEANCLRSVMRAHIEGKPLPRCQARKATLPPLPARKLQPLALEGGAELAVSGDATCAWGGPKHSAYCWGRFDTANDSVNSRPISIEQFSRTRAIAFGLSEICSLDGAGVLRCYNPMSWGRAEKPAFAESYRSSFGGVAAVRGRGGIFCAQTFGGKVLCWPDPGHRPTAVRGLPRVHALSVSYRDGCALDGSGAPWCWSFDDEGQGSKPTRAAAGLVLEAITVGERFVCGVTKSRRIGCWERDGSTPFELRESGSVRQLALGGRGSSVVLREPRPYEACAVLDSGRVACWDLERPNAKPWSIPGPTQAIAIDGARHFCVAESTGSVWCWGRNEAGQLGQGRSSGESGPARVVQPR